MPNNSRGEGFVLDLAVDELRTFGEQVRLRLENLRKAGCGGANSKG
jgi:hypothetical protein